MAGEMVGRVFLSRTWARQERGPVEEEDQGAWSTAGGLGAVGRAYKGRGAGMRARPRGRKRRLYPRAKGVSGDRSLSTLCRALCQRVEGAQQWDRDCFWAWPWPLRVGR